MADIAGATLSYDPTGPSLSATDAMTVALFVLTILMVIYVLGLRLPRH